MDIQLLRSYFRPKVIAGFPELLQQNQVTCGDTLGNTTGFSSIGSIDPTITLDYITSDNYEGAGCIKQTNGYDGSNNVYLMIGSQTEDIYSPVVAGNTYHPTGYVKANTNKNVRFKIRWHNSSKSYISQSSGNYIAINNSSWLPIYASLKAPANAVYAIPTIEWSGTLNHYIEADQLSFKRSA